MQDAVGPRTSVFLSDVETDSWRPGLLDELAAKSARWLITRGEFGAHEYMDGNSVHLPPEKVSQPVAMLGEILACVVGMLVVSPFVQSSGTAQPEIGMSAFLALSTEARAPASVHSLCKCIAGCALQQVATQPNKLCLHLEQCAAWVRSGGSCGHERGRGHLCDSLHAGAGAACAQPGR